MAEDKEILKEVWEGRIPICFKLSSEDVLLNEPDDIYVRLIYI
jgi:autophagy-related protein 5